MSALRLYVDARYPSEWVGEYDGHLWRFPAENNGWGRRQSYTAPAERLREVGAHNGAGTGWPGSHIPANPNVGSA